MLVVFTCNEWYFLSMYVDMRKLVFGVNQAKFQNKQACTVSEIGYKLEANYSKLITSFHEKVSSLKEVGGIAS